MRKGTRRRETSQASDEALANGVRLGMKGRCVALPDCKGCSFRVGGTQNLPRPLNNRTCGCRWGTRAWNLYVGRGCIFCGMARSMTSCLSWVFRVGSAGGTNLKGQNKGQNEGQKFCCLCCLLASFGSITVVVVLPLFLSLRCSPLCAVVVECRV